MPHAPFTPSPVFVAGGTGYLGRAAVPELLRRGHRVTLLVRPGSERRAPSGAELLPGDPLDPASYRHAPEDTLLLLVGTPRPAPWKGRLFESVDYAAGAAAAAALALRPARHVIYLSVAHPAPVMRAYWRVRERVERLLAATGVPATFLRPWYVLGPGHRWAALLVPFYRLGERVPASRETARRLGLVRLPEMTAALARVVGEPPARGVRILEPEDLRAAGSNLALPEPH